MMKKMSKMYSTRKGGHGIMKMILLPPPPQRGGN